MPCDREFLNNAKIFIHGIDSSILWLFEPRTQLAVRCELSSLVEQDFSALETPSNSLYRELAAALAKELPALAVNPQVSFVNQAAIRQRLSDALPLLCSLIEGDAMLKSVGQQGRDSSELVKAALHYVDTLSSEVQK